MATITREGITPTTLAQYVERLQNLWRTALGPDLSLETETPQGQLIDGLSIVFAEIDDVIVSLGNAYSLDRADGVMQDDQADLLGVDRRMATRSTVTATLAGVATTVIPAGRRVNTTDGNTFRTLASATIPTGGSIDVDMESVDLGPISAPAGELSDIVDVISGWETATNAADAILGRNEETQAAFRLRYRRHVGRNSLSVLQSLESNLLEVDGVMDALARDNDTAAAIMVQSVSIPAGTIYSVAEGGDDDDVAQAIYDHKPGGIGTSGNTAVNVDQVDAAGMSIGTVAVNFTRATLSPLTVAFTLTPGPLYPSDGAEQINDGLVAYIASQQGVSDPVDTTRILTPILAVPGHMIGAVTVARKTSGMGAPAAWDNGTTYAVNDQVVDAVRSGTGNTVYRAVAASTGTDPSTQTDDTVWRAVGVAARADILLYEKLTLAAADITITIA